MPFSFTVVLRGSARHVVRSSYGRRRWPDPGRERCGGVPPCPARHRFPPAIGRRPTTASPTSRTRSGTPQRGCRAGRRRTGPCRPPAIAVRAPRIGPAAVVELSPAQPRTSALRRPTSASSGTPCYFSSGVARDRRRPGTGRGRAVDEDSIARGRPAGPGVDEEPGGRRPTGGERTARTARRCPDAGRCGAAAQSPVAGGSARSRRRRRRSRPGQWFREAVVDGPP